MRIATEGALWGSIQAHGFLHEAVIVSDDAGQFDVGQHALCWVHAERLVHKLDTFTDQQRAAQQHVRGLIWWFYADLKAYRADPTPRRRGELRARFDRIFRRRTGFATLDRLLQRLHANKAELLMVLDRPEIPLHTNGSENDIRCQVTKRQVSGGTTQRHRPRLPRRLPRPRQDLHASSASRSGTISAAGSAFPAARSFRPSPTSSAAAVSPPETDLRPGFCPGYRGLYYAVDKINGAGGVNGRMIDVIARDTQGDPAKAVNACTEMAASLKVHAVFGPVNSGEAMATNPILTRYKIPNLACGVVDTLIDPAKYPYAFRMGPSSSQWGGANRHFILDILKAKKVAVLGDTTGYGTTTVAAASAAFKQRGAEVVYEFDDRRRRPGLRAAPHSRAQRGRGSHRRMEQQHRLRRASHERPRPSWLGRSAMRQSRHGFGRCRPPAQEAGGTGTRSTSSATKVVASNPAASCLPASRRSWTRWPARSSFRILPCTWVFMAYDAINLVADAVAKTGSSDPDAIANHWSHLKNWPGMYGDYSCTPEQHNAYPTEEVVMAVANSQRNGAMNLAPGYA